MDSIPLSILLLRSGKGVISVRTIEGETILVSSPYLPLSLLSIQIGNGSGKKVSFPFILMMTEREGDSIGCPSSEYYYKTISFQQPLTSPSPPSCLETDRLPMTRKGVKSEVHMGGRGGGVNGIASPVLTLTAATIQFIHSRSFYPFHIIPQLGPFTTNGLTRVVSHEATTYSIRGKKTTVD